MSQIKPQLSQGAQHHLRLFLKRAERIRRSSFFRHLHLQGGAKFKCHFEVGKNLVVEHNFPDDEMIEAVVLSVRLLTQKNDLASFSELERIANSEPISENWKRWLGLVTESVNADLDFELPEKINGQMLTRRHIYDHFMYGEYAHANAAKAAMVDKWKPNPIAYYALMTEFFIAMHSLAMAAITMARFTALELNGKEVLERWTMDIDTAICEL
jgi:hypothetical protein